MKALLASVAVLGVLGAVVPASAHEPVRVSISAPSHSYAAQSARQLERLRIQVRQGVRYGVISRREALRFGGQLHELENLRYYYIRSRGGMSPWEARDLEQRIRAVRFAIRREFWDGRSYGRYGNDGFDEVVIRDHRDGDVRDHRDGDVRDHRDGDVRDHRGEVRDHRGEDWDRR
jgi:hypothetical protein